MIAEKENGSRLAARLHQILGYMIAIPKLTLLLHFLVVLINASTIGRLQHSGKSAQHVR